MSQAKICTVRDSTRAWATFLSPDASDIKVTRSIVVIYVKIFQTESIVEICSKSLARAIGEVLLMKCS